MKKFIQSILAMTPAEVKQHIDRTPSLASNEAEEMLWKGIGDALATRSRVQTSEQHPLALVWAETAISLYQRLAIEVRSEHSRQSHQTSEMCVRCGMINLRGPLSGHTVLDPEPLQEWFLSSTGFVFQTLSHCQTQLASLRDTDFHRYVRLRGRLTILRPLIDKRVFRRHDEMSAWERAVFGVQGE